jgi:simple sugar transport system ATP-binding protein
MRNGQVVTTEKTQHLSEQQLSQLIMGKDRTVTHHRISPHGNTSIFEFCSVSTSLSNKRNLKDVSFNVRSGEIFGLAGIEGNGQDELVQVLAQIIPFSGQVQLLGKPLQALTLYEHRQNGFGLIPPDRHREGLVLNFDNALNLILGHHFSNQYQTKGFLKKSEIYKAAETRLKEFDIRPPSPNLLSAHLSGGNQQKLLLAREHSEKTRFLLACHPTRGVDIGAIDFTHQYLLSLVETGIGILLISSDLDELVALSTRLGVMREGQLVSVRNTSDWTKEELGLWMTGAKT